MLSGLENPELDMKANVNNIIQIQNPTNTKHELVIDSQGKEVATSGEVLEVKYRSGPMGRSYSVFHVNTILIQ